MRRAYLFIETGEVRRTHNGEEWISIGNGSCVRQNRSTYDEYPILTRHEIEIPEGATTFVAFPSDAPMDAFIPGTSVPIPRPKKKVKKWRWAYERTPYPHDFDQPTHVRISDRHYATEGDFKTIGGIVWCQRLEHTEIEVEE